MADKIKQDEIILRFTKGSVPKRTRVRSGLFNKQVSIKYFLPKRTDENVHQQVQVCKNKFLSVFQVTKRRVENVCKKYFNTGNSPEEGRGGDTRSKHYENHRSAVRRFIEKLQPVQCHYNRAKNTSRHYLLSGLSIKCLWQLFYSESEFKVKYDYFRNIFDLVEKSKLSTELKVHKMKADRFYQKLKEKNEGVLTFSFDCQKNQVLPKIPDQQAYYSRQLHIYNFTIYLGSSKNKQTKENTFIYSWLESEHKKGSNEIASCLFHRLNLTDWTDIHTLHLFSDGCGGQNKNQVLLGMLCKWFHCHAPSHIKNIIYIFPIVGHSYLPPDRVFGRLEKQVKKISTISTAD